LPNIYKVIFDQTNELMTEGLNEHRKTLRMRARPKILLAKNYEDAIALYEKYTKTCWVSFLTSVIAERARKTIRQASNWQIHSQKKTARSPLCCSRRMPGIQKIMRELKVSFINKYSKTLLVELKHYIKENYGFGDFVFKDPYQWDGNRPRQ
jgi:hypothetical protein